MNDFCDVTPVNSRKNWLALFFLTELAAFFWVFSFPYWEWLYSAASLALFGCLVYVIYFCERFSTFFLMYYVGGLGSFALMGSAIGYMVVEGYVEGTVPDAVVVGCGLLLLVLVAQLHVYFFGVTNVVLITEGREVVSVENPGPQRSDLNAGLLSGIGTLIGGVFVSSVGGATAGVVICVLLLGGCLAMVFYMRHILRGIRKLRLKEKRKATIFTFKNIDAVREARGRWWSVRLFRWLLSWRGSTN